MGRPLQRVTLLPGSVGDYLVAEMGASPRAPARPRCSADTGWKPAKTLLALDNVTGGHAEPLYPHQWAGSGGELPDYALRPQGGLRSTTTSTSPLSRIEGFNQVFQEHDCCSGFRFTHPGGVRPPQAVLHRGPAGPGTSAAQHR